MCKHSKRILTASQCGRAQGSWCSILPNVSYSELRLDGIIVYPHLTVKRQSMLVIEKQTNLGLWIHAPHKLNLQCANAAYKAAAAMRGIKQAFMQFAAPLFERFPIFIRPHLDISVQAWRPWNAPENTLQNLSSA